MSEEADVLVGQAQKQLDEHKKWLAGQIYMLPAAVAMDAAKMLLVTQVGEIRLRVARVHGGVASVIYEYPNDLHAFLSSASTPEHLRAAVAGGHVVDPNQPASTARIVGGE